MKKCPKCEKILEEKYFNKNKNTKSGFSSRCKKCHLADVIKYQQKNKDKTNINKARYKQTLKGKKTNTKYKRGEACRLARKRYNSSQLGYAAAARWRANRKKAEYNVREQNNLTYKQWVDILEKQEFKCACCKIKFDENTIATKDHIIPLSKGGALTKNNVQGLCQSCNSAKCDKIIVDLASFHRSRVN